MAFCKPVTDWSCRGGRPTPPPGSTEEEVLAFEAVVERAEVFAWMSLSALTAQNVATCPVAVRPCRKSHLSTLGFQFNGSGAPWFPVPFEGKWINVWCSGDCGFVEEIVLPRPVGPVTEVWVDGVELPPTAYRLDNGNRLVRLDGGSWPATQDMTAAENEPGSFVVKYWPGNAPDVAICAAAGVLANEFYLACSGQECRLPVGVTEISRQGVTMTMISDMFEMGKTGIFEVDAVISAYNPFRKKARSLVYSPDMNRGRRTSWSA